MSWAAITTSVIAAGLSVGVAAASAPDYSSPSKSSRKTVMAGLKALPGQRKVEAAARLGESVDYETGRMVPVYEDVSIDKLLAQHKIGQSDYDRLKGQGVETQRVKTGMAPDTRTADFTGYGDADVQGELARKMAGIQLELQKKYGADFVNEAKKQQELADPEGTAARKLLAEQINAAEDARLNRKRPVAEALNSGVMADLERGRGVDESSQEAIAAVLARRGDTSLKGGDIETELAAGPAGDQRARDRLQQAMGFASSGQSPTDAAYRERQQSLANMASFLGGRTPQSQFAGMGAAQQGASPTPGGAPLVNLPGNIQQVGQSAGLQRYQQGVQNAANNVSPWFAGLTLATKGATVAGQAGAKPFA